MMNKEDIRNEIKSKRRAFPKENRAKESENVCRAIISSDEFKNAEYVCLYMPSFGEVDILPILEPCRKNGKKVLVPVTDTKQGEVHLCYANEPFSKGAYGILEPVHKRYEDKNKVDLFIVPGIAFDKNGVRLGFGGGYYDKLLVGISAIKFGVCYSFQMVEQLPCEVHDIKMDKVICGH